MVLLSKNLLNRYLILLTLFVLAFIPRFIIWIYPAIGWGRLVIYDVVVYTEYGQAMVDALLIGDLKEFASINVGVPPLGTIVVGAFVRIFGGVLGDIYKAGLLAPVIFSSLSAPLMYLILRRYSDKAAYAASILFILDPYLIQCSSAYLDAIGVFFILIYVLLFMSSDIFMIKRSVFMGILMMLSILTKFTFMIFAVFFILLLMLVKRDYRLAATLATFSALSLTFIPWLWFQETFQEALLHHASLNSILPPILFGPLLIGVPESYPWYFLTYFGLGQVHWNVLASFSHLLFFAALIYVSLKREFLFNSKMMIFLLASVLSTAFIPRNYWTYTWSMGFMRSETVLFRQFYHYYFYLTNIAAGAAACKIFFDRQNPCNRFCSKIFLAIIALYGLTAPYVAVMNSFFPFWSLIFTLILNFSRDNPVMGHYGMIAFIITLLMLFTVIAGAIMIVSRYLRE